MRRSFFYIAAACLFIPFCAFSQVTGGGREFDPDSVIIFKSPRPMLTFDEEMAIKNNAIGVDMILSESGFGAGVFYDKKLSSDLTFFVSLYISGARNSDELEFFNPQTGELFVPYKKNRLYNLPLTAGVKYFPFDGQIFQSFRPFVNAGLGYSLIISTPYSQGFFSAFGDGRYHGRFAGFIGAGAEFGIGVKTVSSVSFRYFTVPFGSPGLESLDSELSGVPPITNFGGPFIAFSVGWRF